MARSAVDQDRSTADQWWFAVDRWWSSADLSRSTVETVAHAARAWGLPEAEIAAEYGLSLAQVREALAFSEAHHGEIEAELAEEQRLETGSQVARVRVRLHLDADTSIRSLHRALLCAR